MTGVTRLLLGSPCGTRRGGVDFASPAGRSEIGRAPSKGGLSREMSQRRSRMVPLASTTGIEPLLYCSCLQALTEARNSRVLPRVLQPLERSMRLLPVENWKRKATYLDLAIVNYDCHLV